MNKQIVNFYDTETEEYKFHQNKRPILINDIDVNKIVVYLISFRLVIKSLNISLIVYTYMYIKNI